MPSPTEAISPSPSPNSSTHREEMSDAPSIAVDLPHGVFNSGLDVPPFDTAFFSPELLGNDGGSADNPSNDAFDIDSLDLDFSFDDLAIIDLESFLNPNPPYQSDLQTAASPNFPELGPYSDQLHAVFKSASSELQHVSPDGEMPGDRSWDGSGILNSTSPVMDSHQISVYLNMQSPESNGSNHSSTENSGADGNGLNYPSPKSQGSENFGSNVSEGSNNSAVRSANSAPDSSKCSTGTGVVDQRIRLEVSANSHGNSSLLKRKKDCKDVMNTNSESRINKSNKSNCNAENEDSVKSSGLLSEEEERKRARLMRNRESAQLSRQRKKYYVEELEDKVRNMHATIQDLNSKISYFMAENVTLRQQMSGGIGGGAAAAPAVPPPPMVPPPHGMYPHPAMMYPWMPCAPPYMVKPQGSQVPLVPIPRLKPQQTAQAPKTNKKVENKKNYNPKTKKVAGVSFLGLLFFIMLFGGLVPLFNARYKGVNEALMGGESYIRGGFNEKHHGRVLMFNGTGYGEKYGGEKDYSDHTSLHCGGRDHGTGRESRTDEFAHLGNGSEPLAASLYVPRNDKLVKIDGNLIIHSVMANEKVMASNGKGDVETGLTVPGSIGPAIPVPGIGINSAKHPLLRALGSGSADMDGTKSAGTDGRLQQWFREGLAGPMLASGMCSEVFRFDVSTAIVPATTTKNMTETQNQNSSYLIKGMNRRFLHPIPLPESSSNASKEHGSRSSEKEGLHGYPNSTSMVVSVLFDPREVADTDVDAMMGTKTLSQIFVVVLVDSVKYVTYSCMLPFKGFAPHLVTA